MLTFFCEISRISSWLFLLESDGQTPRSASSRGAAEWASDGGGLVDLLHTTALRDGLMNPDALLQNGNLDVSGGAAQLQRRLTGSQLADDRHDGQHRAHQA